MRSKTIDLKGFWLYLWQLHRQSKKMLSLNFAGSKSGAALLEKENTTKEIKLGTEKAEETGSEGDPGQKKGLDQEGGYALRQKIGLFLGPALFVILLLMPTPLEMSREAQHVLAGTAWIASWWVSEAIPIPVTSLLPIVLFPLAGALPVNIVTAPYANPNVFLFMGGFMIAICMERWELHRRVALNIINLVGTSPNRLVLGFMAATAFLSMWISNTATAMMMLPIALAVISQVAALIKEKGIQGIEVARGKFRFGTCLMLSIAYAASIGGVASLIGSPPNIVFAGVVEEMFGITVGFAQWMMYGLPISIVFLLIAWYYLTHIAHPSGLKEIPGGKAIIRKELRLLGTISREEKAIALVFFGVAVAWIIRSFVLQNIFPFINDALIAILGAFVTFLIPVDLKKGHFLNNWETAVEIPWGILLLFGGGLSLATAFGESGLAQWIGMRLAALENASMLFIMLAVVALVIYLTEVTSNTATTSMMMPIMATMALAMKIHPFALMITAATAASYAFMLPVATPPNAVVFGSGYLSIPQMVKAGFWLTVLAIIVITAFGYLWLPLIWGIDVNVFPSEWLLN